MYAQVDKLKSQNVNLSEKNKELSESLEKKKRELLVLKRAAQTQASRKVVSSNSSNNGLAGFLSKDNAGNIPQVGIDILPAPTQLKHSLDDLHINTKQDTDLLEIARKYKERYCGPSSFCGFYIKMIA